MTTATPPRGIRPLARREMRLAYGMLLPTFIIVLAVVLGPLIANFWISFKPVQLADLRPASLLINERLRAISFSRATRRSLNIEFAIRPVTRKLNPPVLETSCLRD